MRKPVSDRILVTGGAKRLGAVLCRAVAKPGRHIVVHYNRSADSAEALVSELNAAGVAASIVQADLSEAGDLDALIAAAAELAGGPVTALVNNASVFDYDTPTALDASVMETAMQVNLFAPVKLAEQFFLQAEANAKYVVVNIFDQKLWNINPDFYSYTSSKMALLAATQMMDMAFGERARACAIAPGLLFPSYDQTEQEFVEVASKNVLEKPVDPLEVGKALDYILAAKTFRGQVLHVDNGQRLFSLDRDVMFSTRGD